MPNHCYYGSLVINNTQLARLVGRESNPEPSAQQAGVLPLSYHTLYVVVCRPKWITMREIAIGIFDNFWPWDVELT